MRRLRDLQAPAYSPEIPVWISWNDGRAAVWLIFPRRSLLPMCRAAWRAQQPHLRQLAWRATAGAAFGAGPTIPGTGGSGPIPRRVRFVPRQPAHYAPRPCALEPSPGCDPGDRLPRGSNPFSRRRLRLHPVRPEPPSIPTGLPVRPFCLRWLWLLRRSTAPRALCRLPGFFLPFAAALESVWLPRKGRAGVPLRHAAPERTPGLLHNPQLARPLALGAFSQREWAAPPD